MSTEREKALSALREWSVPGRRADLVAAAWRTGATVVAIAEAARAKSRQTIYDDLKSRGIDPRDRPKGKNMTAVTVEGFNGVDDDQPGGPLYDAVVAKHEGRAAAPDSQEFGRMLALSMALGQYNDLRASLAEEEDARTERDRALHLVDVRWEALADPNSKGSWLHGHQAYVRAEDDAHRAIEAWKVAAETLTRLASLRRGEDADRLVDAYEQFILPAGHPPADKPDVDAEAEAAQLHEALHTQHARRQRLAAETLSLAARN
ncbi:hypothetical protein [Streptomyces sp. NPDC017230]|uniref:hypothetical protein n=1 Tax=unclassified Streptomyces TaxID=2593676 RepID=UPI00379FE216